MAALNVNPNLNDSMSKTQKVLVETNELLEFYKDWKECCSINAFLEHHGFKKTANATDYEKYLKDLSAAQDPPRLEEVNKVINSSAEEWSVITSAGTFLESYRCFNECRQEFYDDVLKLCGKNDAILSEFFLRREFLIIKQRIENVLNIPWGTGDCENLVVPFKKLYESNQDTEQRIKAYFDCEITDVNEEALLKRFSNLCIKYRGELSDVSVIENLTPLMFKKAPCRILKEFFGTYGKDYKNTVHVAQRQTKRNLDVSRQEWCSSESGLQLIHLLAENPEAEEIIVYVKEQFKNGIEDIAVVNDKGSNLCHLAAQHGNTDLVKFISSKKFREIFLTYDLSSTPNNFQELPIHKAAEGGEFDTLVELETHTYFALNVRSALGTPLHYATKHDKLACALYLIHNSSRQDLNLRDQDGKTALHNAALAQNAVIQQILIQKGINLSIMDNKGRTALDYCVRRDDIGIITVVNPFRSIKEVKAHAQQFHDHSVTQIRLRTEWRDMKLAFYTKILFFFVMIASVVVDALHILEEQDDRSIAPRIIAGLGAFFVNLMTVLSAIVVVSDIVKKTPCLSLRSVCDAGGVLFQIFLDFSIILIAILCCFGINAPLFSIPVACFAVAHTFGSIPTLAHLRHLLYKWAFFLILSITCVLCVNLLIHRLLVSELKDVTTKFGVKLPHLAEEDLHESAFIKSLSTTWVLPGLLHSLSSSDYKDSVAYSHWLIVLLLCFVEICLLIAIVYGLVRVAKHSEKGQKCLKTIVTCENIILVSPFVRYVRTCRGKHHGSCVTQWRISTNELRCTSEYEGDFTRSCRIDQHLINSLRALCIENV